MISEKNINKGTLRFNHDHYMKVRKVHKPKNRIYISADWDHYYDECNKIINHPLLYKVIRDMETKTLYIVTKVLRRFYAGYHIVLQYDNKNGSSGICYLDNGTSIALTDKANFNTLFEVTDLTPNQFFESCEGAVNAFGEKAKDWFYWHKENNDKVLKHFAECG